ncbi:MAG: hypothetical protein JO013_02420 [Alphaproteobacteria bacterium]|nr:hypothetical protein [Alphaproteobacteria bacterium]
MVATTAILAVALGLAPVAPGGAQQVRVSAAAVAQAVGRCEQKVDRRGTVRLTGFDRRSGRAFDIRIDHAGHVEANVGAWLYTFDVAGAA